MCKKLANFDRGQTTCVRLEVLTTWLYYILLKIVSKNEDGNSHPCATMTLR